ncbi:MAG: FAD-dependent oxidoreductase [Candidatus Omnitrophica bacterium]|nr:FAD-dependent oxidoreductase [Candidatus Omnitrophota bacterium]
MKIIIVGINHAGTSALRTMLAQNSTHEITAYDRNDNISFLGCGIALVVGGAVKNIRDLFYCTPLKLEKKGAKVRMNHEVIAVDYKAHTVKVKNLLTNEVFSDNYDKLVFAAGSWPMDIPNIPKEHDNLENVNICKLYQHAEELIKKGDDPSIKKVAIVGSGYIGIELAEAYHKKGKKVTLIDVEKRTLARYFDIEFTAQLEADMLASGITLALGEKVIDFSGENNKVKKVITDKGSYEADLVVKCIGFKPNTELLPDAKKTANGALLVDKHMRTNLPDIYGIGDCVAIYHAAFERPMQVALATNAVKSGITAASHINGNEAVKIDSVAGTNAISVFANKLASTGVSEETALRLNLPVASSYIEDNDRPEFMEAFSKTKIKIVYDKNTLRLLGAQIGSYGSTSHTEVIYYLALAIQQRLTLLDIAFTDVYFLPHFNKPFNFVLTSIMQAIGLNYYKD